VSLVSIWLRVTFIGPKSCLFIVGNCLCGTVIEPNICGSLVRNWLNITAIEPNICRP